MKLGAEPKKVAALAGLLVIAGVVYWYMSSDGSSPAPRPVASAPVPTAVPPVASPRVTRKTTDRRSTNRSTVSEFKVRLGVADPKDRPDPSTIDPTIRFDLLAKVQAIEVGAPGRNLFQLGPPPPPPAPKGPLPKTPIIPVSHPPMQSAPPVDSGPPPPPQAPPMTFKYYGFKVSKNDGRKAAFLLDGDEILIAGENDTFKRRYRVVKIGLNSITIEDTQFKSQQTLQLQENPTG